MIRFSADVERAVHNVLAVDVLKLFSGIFAHWRHSPLVSLLLLFIQPRNIQICCSFVAQNNSCSEWNDLNVECRVVGAVIHSSDHKRQPIWDSLRMVAPENHAKCQNSRDWCGECDRKIIMMIKLAQWLRRWIILSEVYTDCGWIDVEKVFSVQIEQYGM